MTIQINGTSGISGVDGSAATPALQGSDTNTGISFGADTVNINTGGTTRATVDSSGRVLVGTSSAISGGVIDSGSGSQSSLPYLQIAGTDWAQSSAVFASYQNAAAVFPQISLNKSKSGTVGTIGVALASGDALGGITFSGSDGTKFVAGASIASYVDGTPGANDMPGRIVFSTTADGASSPTERVRITQNGFLKASNTGSYANVDGHEFVTSIAESCRIQNTNASPFGLRITHNTDSNGTGNAFLTCMGNVTVRAEFRSNGGLANFSANNANLSDRNAKKDISLAAGTWDCIKEWEIVNYRYKDQPDDADLNLGVIAQQVAESCPEVITVFQEAKEATEDQPAQEERLGVKEQQMYWMAIKALQEAQVRIEQLEAKVAALESA